LEVPHHSRISLHAVHWHNLILHYLLSLYTFIRHIKLNCDVVSLGKHNPTFRNIVLFSSSRIVISSFFRSVNVILVLSDFTQHGLVPSYRRFGKPIRAIFKGPTVNSPCVFIVLPLIKQGASWPTSWNTHKPTAKPVLHTDKKNNYKKLYTILSCVGVSTSCTCCILICLVCFVASFKLSFG